MGMPLAPWSGLSSVAVKPSSGLAVTFNTIRSSKAPALIAPCQEPTSPLSGFFERLFVHRPSHGRRHHRSHKYDHHPFHPSPRMFKKYLHGQGKSAYTDLIR